MSVILLAWRYLAARRLLNFLTVLGVALGVGLVTAAMAIANATRTSAIRNNPARRLYRPTDPGWEPPARIR